MACRAALEHELNLQAKLRRGQLTLTLVLDGVYFGCKAFWGAGIFVLSLSVEGLLCWPNGKRAGAHVYLNSFVPRGKAACGRGGIFTDPRLRKPFLAIYRLYIKVLHPVTLVLHVGRCTDVPENLQEIEYTVVLQLQC